MEGPPSVRVSISILQKNLLRDMIISTAAMRSLETFRQLKLSRRFYYRREEDFPSGALNVPRFREHFHDEGNSAKLPDLVLSLRRRSLSTLYALIRLYLEEIESDARKDEEYMRCQ